MRQVLPLALKVTDWAKVTAGELQRAIYPPISPSPMPHELKLQTYTSTPGLFVCIWTPELKSSCLLVKRFTDPVISLVQTLILYVRTKVDV